MTTPLKIGIAVACLLGVAGLIAKDQWNADRRDAGTVVPGTGKPESVVAPPAAALSPQVREQPGDSVHGPQIPSPPAGAGIRESGAKNLSPAKHAEAPARPPGEGAQNTLSAAPATPGVDPMPADPLKEESRLYTVVQGDSLYGISVKVFGTPRHYERIYEANRDRIKDPNTLQIGINLKIPEVSPKPGSGPSGTTSQVPSPGRTDSTSAPPVDRKPVPH
jgi:LysM repeat protein